MAAPPVSSGGKPASAPLRHDEGQAARPECRGEDVGGRGHDPGVIGLVMVGQEQDDPLVERPVLGGEQPSEAAGGVERDAQPIDRVGRQRRRARPRPARRSPRAPGRAASSGTHAAALTSAAPPRHRAPAARRSVAPTGRPGRAPRSPGRRPPRPPAAPRSAPRPGRVRGRRHRHAMTGLLDHLEVVVLVAHRQRLLERDPEMAGEPAQGLALRHARREELEELRVADRDLGPAGEVRRAASSALVGRAGVTDREDLRDRMADPALEVRARSRRAPRGTPSSRRCAGRRPG